MIPVLSSASIREIDRISIERQGISSLELMERAAQACFERIMALFPDKNRYLVVCGNGNNGGDGLVIARKLVEAGKQVRVILALGKKGSPDFETTLQAYTQKHGNWISETWKEDWVSESDILIEALLGSGINRPAEGEAARTISEINRSGLNVISIDVPAGLRSDAVPAPGEVLVRADVCLGLQGPRESFFYPESATFLGYWEIIDIGLDPEAMRASSDQRYLLEEQDIHTFFKTRNPFSHKGSFGHALLLAGSEGMGGAALLAAEGALRSGCGKLTAALPANLAGAMHCRLPEAMVKVDPNPEYLSRLPESAAYSAICMGPGIGKNAETAGVLRLLIQDNRLPLILDADALNLLAENKTWLRFFNSPVLLTPHRGEFARLFGEYSNSVDLTKMAREQARILNVFILVKGHYSFLACPDGSLLFNNTGNPGMAKGGSGDVLSGIICGLCARGYSLFQAALIGMFVHGRAGDAAAHEMGMEAMLPQDLLKKLPEVYRFFET